MITLALPIWQGRLSPVFDFCTAVQLYSYCDGVFSAGARLEFVSQDAYGRAALLRGAGVRVLLCGAVSRAHQFALRQAGIELHSHICGEPSALLQAYAAGELHDFRMPGCGRGMRRGCGRGQGRGGRGPGGGRRGAAF
ncbi:MAG: hypothetical protein PHG44_06915 [Lentisphaeria bacterium]|jgi:predicted Fe-Mo cluster-binding NifX family protein|nr:hypothetical protein [Lentisphaeria bacterium]MDY0176306.1 hypothetical protein [Lentisphaeria bacterium]NLZ59845.1 hypothetical protein [Lentisphaerota bacterium]